MTGEETAGVNHCRAQADCTVSWGLAEMSAPPCPVAAAKEDESG